MKWTKTARLTLYSFQATPVALFLPQNLEWLCCVAATDNLSNNRSGVTLSYLQPQGTPAGKWATLVEESSGERCALTWDPLSHSASLRFVGAGLQPLHRARKRRLATGLTSLRAWPPPAAIGTRRSLHFRRA